MAGRWFWSHPDDAGDTGDDLSFIIFFSRNIELVLVFL